MFKIKASDFNLDHTLSCGQVFRWKKLDDGFWYGVIGKRVVKIRQDSDFLFFASNNNKYINTIIKQYFNLNVNYKAIIKSISKAPKIRKMITSSYGLRILKQDPWECLISYIISINKNIPAINCLIENICQKYGHRIDFEGMSFYTFPTPDELKHLKTHHIRACSVGFRDRYIKDAIDKVYSKKIDLKKLAKLSYPEAKAELIKIVGVGSKVADCILLFAYNKYEAFPVDVWIKRAMKKLYGIKKDNDILPFASKHFGKFAGYAQEFIYFSPFARGSKLTP
jgi:N-glycosylase/DNA lyase